MFGKRMIQNIILQQADMILSINNTEIFIAEIILRNFQFCHIYSNAEKGNLTAKRSKINNYFKVNEPKEAAIMKKDEKSFFCQPTLNFSSLKKDFNIMALSPY
jgi:hypothetical protein